MSTDRIFRRQVLRAAAQIREQPARAGQIVQRPVLDDYEWSELQRLTRHFNLAQERGWRKAADSLIPDLDYAASRLSRRMESFKSDLPQVAPTGIASASEIAGDLFALRDEFEELEVHLKARQISVQTLPIHLEGTDLGAFKVVLPWESIGRGGGEYQVVAVDPRPAAGNDEVTHPHVSSAALCEGRGADSIRSALAQGRLLDFFTLVKQILETYNAGSAYVPLSRWTEGEECSDCGDGMDEDESWSCRRCYKSICGDCRNCCEKCDEFLCRGCSATCALCDGTFCRRCLISHPETQAMVCDSCLEKGTTSDEEEPAETASEESAAEMQFSPSASEVDALCLEEAAVPA